MPTPDRRRPVALVAVVLTLVLAGAWFVARPQPTGAVVPAAAAGRPVVGQALPDFRATTLDGKAVSLSQFRGRPVWLSFGATWCAPCRAEAPDIQAAYRATRGSGVEVLFVYLQEGPEPVREYSTRLGTTFTHIPDPDGSISSTYGATSLPTHYFVDREGVLRATHLGILTRNQMDANLADIGANAG